MTTAKPKHDIVEFCARWLQQRRLSKASTALLGALGIGAGLAATTAALRRANRIDLAGKTVIVTGGSRGLGLLLAEEFGRRGARVAICGRDPEAVSAAQARLFALGIETLARACDLSDRTMADAFVDEVAETFGRIDVVVNNAGTIRVSAFDDQTVEDLEDAMRANFWGPVHVTFRAMGRLRVHGRDARIVNIASVGGRIGFPHLLGYSAAKFALMGFSEVARAELDGMRAAPRVVTVIPGLMRTGSFENAEFTGKLEQELTWFAAASSAPLVTIDARTAAKRIVRATQDGRRFLRIGVTAHVADALHRLSPSLAARAMSVAAKLLPNAGRNEGEAPRKGRDIASPVRGTAFAKLGEAAADANNERR